MSGSHHHSVTLVESIPKSLYDLLTREIAFRSTRAKLVTSLDESQRHLNVVRASRPPFMILQRTKVRDELKSSLTTAEDTIAMLEKGLAKLNQMEPKLHAYVSYRLENYLRKASPDYVRSLIDKRQPYDWHRVLSQFDHYTTALQSSLHLLDAAIAGLLPFQSISSQPQCNLLLSQVILAAEQFEAEIVFLNKVADTQSKKTGPGSHTLHRQLELDWGGAFRSLAADDGRTGPAALRQLMIQFKEVSNNARHAIQDECVSIEGIENVQAKSFHARQWSLLREVIELRVNPGDLDELARETEFYLENGYIAELARTQEEMRPPPKVPKPTASTAAKSAPPPNKNQVVDPVLQLPTRKSEHAHRSRTPAPAAAPIVAKLPEPPLSSDSAMVAMKAELEKEIERLRAEREELLARTRYVEESETKLLDRTQEQQEREVMLEQRAEDLIAMERRLRSLQPQSEQDDQAEKPVRVFDEFNE